MDDRTYDLMVQQAKKYGDALSELSFAKSRIEQLEAALREIACQKKTDELETSHDVEFADFEDGYDRCIDTARAALGEKKDD